ncbi:McrC family protein [Flectobacillus major]|uniref:McrC family protein n=1 Tax=Flectobacillus major TaxID=103 RepID=UPI0003FAA18F|nr:hypothetical protein [Flectobacillus major]
MIQSIYEFGKEISTGLSDDKIKRFKTYLDEVWQSRKQYGLEEDERDSFYGSDKKKQRFLTFDGDKIRANNYVGFIQFEGLTLNIYPKICQEMPQEQISSKVLYWLSYGKKINLPFAELPLDRQAFDTWLEAFIFLFAHHTEEILTNQPYQSYQEITEETSYLRGSLAIQPYVQHNLLTGRHQFFHCTYEPFLYDNQFNRIVKFVSRMLLSFTNNEKSKQKLNSLLFLLDDVADEYCQESHCDLVKLNPLYQDLAIILEMARMFLSSSSISQSDTNKNNFCLLLPMEVVFEEFIFGIIETHFSDRKPNAQGKGFLTEQSVFQIKNDIILQNPNLVIDTKYKIRDKKDSKKGISQTDMYQMLAYSIRREIDQVLLIYPKNGAKPSEVDTFTIADKFANDKLITIKAADIDICGEEDEIIRQINEVLATD